MDIASIAILLLATIGPTRAAIVFVGMTQSADNGPLAVASAKKVMNAGNDMSNKDSIHQEAAVFGVVAKSHDKAEGTKAFVEKRQPVFTRS